jgi:predicted transcriptional regulator
VRRFHTPKMPTEGKAVHPLVRWIWDQIVRQRVAQEDLAERAGVCSSTLRKWRKGERSPQLYELEAVVNVLGGKLNVRVRDD